MLHKHNSPEDQIKVNIRLRIYIRVCVCVPVYWNWYVDQVNMYSYLYTCVRVSQQTAGASYGYAEGDW